MRTNGKSSVIAMKAARLAGVIGGRGRLLLSLALLAAASHASKLRGRGGRFYLIRSAASARRIQRAADRENSVTRLTKLPRDIVRAECSPDACMYRAWVKRAFFSHLSQPPPFSHHL